MAKTRTLEIPSVGEVSRVADKATKEASDTLGGLQDLHIQTTADCFTATAIAAEIKEQATKVADLRTYMDAPLKESLKRHAELFAPSLAAFKDAEALIKAKLAEYQRTVESRRTAFETEALEADTSDKRAELMSLANAQEMPKIDGCSFRQKWTGRTIDSGRIVAWLIENGCLDMLKPDEGKLRKFTSIAARDPQIDGWEAYQETTVAIIVDKVKK